MSKLKDNIDNISAGTENIAKDYQKLLMIKITERLSLFIGILFSVFIVSTLLLIVLLICSVALSAFLNKILSSEFWGYLMVAALYILIIVFLIIRMVRTETPLLSNLFVKLMVVVLDIEVNQSKNMQGLKQEKENVNEKLDLSKEKIKSDFQLLKYSLLDSLLKDFLGLFARKNKTSKKKPAPAKAKKKPRKKD
jgi:hypothetical protein